MEYLKNILSEIEKNPKIKMLYIGETGSSVCGFTLAFDYLIVEKPG